MHSFNSKKFSPTQSSNSFSLFKIETNSFKKRLAPLIYSSSPKLFGIIFINCSGTRCTASISSRLTFLMFINSSFAFISLSKVIWMPSFFPFGLYVNRLRKVAKEFCAFHDVADIVHILLALRLVGHVHDEPCIAVVKVVLRRNCVADSFIRADRIANRLMPIWMTLFCCVSVLMASACVL